MMEKSKKFSIFINKDKIPKIFIDTFMWSEIFKNNK